MKTELMQEMTEKREMEKKATAYDLLITLLNNTLTYMYEQGMSKEEVADYVGSSTDLLDAVDDEDLDGIINDI